MGNAGYIVAADKNEVNCGYHLYIEDVHALRDATAIGQTIKFKTDRYFRKNDKNVGMERIITGKVVEKYPHVFKLDTGYIYSWVDYILGKIL